MPKHTSISIARPLGIEICWWYKRCVTMLDHVRHHTPVSITSVLFQFIMIYCSIHSYAHDLTLHFQHSLPENQLDHRPHNLLSFYHIWMGQSKPSFVHVSKTKFNHQSTWQSIPENYPAVFFNVTHLFPSSPLNIFDMSFTKKLNW